MTNIETPDDLVNDQIAFHDKLATLHASDPYRLKKHTETAARFRKLKQYIDDLVAKLADAQLENLIGPVGQAPTQTGLEPYQQLALTPEDIKGLPDELIKELGLSAGDHIEFAIMTMMDGAGGIMSLDRILIGLFKQTTEVFKRQPLTQRLYRMSQKGLVFNVPGKKGVYSRTELSPADVVRIFGDDSNG